MFKKSFRTIKHGDECTLEELDREMKKYNCQRNNEELTKEKLQSRVLNYYDELHCYCVLYKPMVFNKYSELLTTIIIDEIIMLW